ncbi:splicing factor 3A subunit 2-like [Homarus americanus]|uniref:splicing factor 3A subunit 2-like n=1 Tax=Homarus americanus TaxID=6706 RepID=UPI001C45E342|nr:splicing factor 3A subunit 2-like [Homarus americanus]
MLCHTPRPPECHILVLSGTPHPPSILHPNPLGANILALGTTPRSSVPTSSPLGTTPAPRYHILAPQYPHPAPRYHTPAPRYHTSAPRYHTPAPRYHMPAPQCHPTPALQCQPNTSITERVAPSSLVNSYIISLHGGTVAVLPIFYVLELNLITCCW